MRRLWHGVDCVREYRGLPHRLLEPRANARQRVRGHRGVRGAGVIVLAQGSEAACKVDLRPQRGMAVLGSHNLEI